MQRSNKVRLSFAALTARPEITSFHQLKNNKNHEQQEKERLTELESISQVGGNGVKKQKTKVVKLIGDRERNISELVQGFGCICGCKNEFKSVVNLLMDKIYRLREQRNQLKKQVSHYLNTNKEKKQLKQSKDAGINTEEFYDIDFLREQLRSLPTQPCQKNNEKNQGDHLLSINTEQVQMLFGCLNKQDPSQDNLNETNLLQTSDLDEEHNVEETNRVQSRNRKVLEEFNQNTDTQQQKLRNINHISKKNHINFNNLQSYIQKITCAKQLQKYDENKRKKVIF